MITSKVEFETELKKIEIDKYDEIIVFKCNMVIYK